MDIETKKTGSSGGRSSRKLMVISLVLTLLLTITVSAVIYLSVWQQNTVSQLKNTTPEFVRHGTLQSNINEEKKSEEISFYKGDNIVTYKELDGTFRAHDLNKGIYYNKNGNDGQCHLLPLPSTAGMGNKFEVFLGKHDNITLASITAEFRVLEGKITDISFIPNVVQDECNGNFRWLANSAQQDGDITKRQTTTTTKTTVILPDGTTVITETTVTENGNSNK